VTQTIEMFEDQPRKRFGTLVVVDGECLTEGAALVGALEFDLERVVMKCIPWKNSTTVIYSFCPTALRPAPRLKHRWTYEHGWHFVEAYPGESGSDKALADELRTYPDLGSAKSIVVLGGDHELVEPASRAMALGVNVTVIGLVGATSRQFERLGAQVLTIPSLSWGGF
jgi:hypothetical protein